MYNCICTSMYISDSACTYTCDSTRTCIYTCMYMSDSTCTCI